MAQAKKASQKPKTPKTRSEKSVVKAVALKQAKNDATEKDRYRMIAEKAYLIAEARGFEGNTSMEDWLLAEKEIGNGWYYYLRWSGCSSTWVDRISNLKAHI